MGQNDQLQDPALLVLSSPGKLNDDKLETLGLAGHLSLPLLPAQLYGAIDRILQAWSNKKSRLS